MKELALLDSGPLAPFQVVLQNQLELILKEQQALGAVLSFQAPKHQWTYLLWQEHGRFLPQALPYQTLFDQECLTNVPRFSVHLTSEQRQRFGERVEEIQVQILCGDGWEAELLLLREKSGPSHERLQHWEAPLQALIQLHELAQKRLVAEITQSDPLTLLPNRAHFIQKVEEEIVKKRKLALLFIDLNRFKRINDTLGHATGDQLLKEVATRFQTTLQAGGTLARLGGDEFTVLLPELRNAKQAQMIAQMILSCVRRPILIGNQELSVGASIGIAVYPKDGKDAQTLLQHADVAMYQAKKRGGWVAYSPTMSSGGYQHLIEERELRHAIAREQLSVMYQPQVDPKTGQWRKLEALVRWEHPTRGMIPTSHFIQLAEQTDQIATLGAFVLRRACENIAFWRTHLAPELRVSVNFSARQVANSDLANLVEQLLKEGSLPGQALEMELTESTLATSLENLPAQLRRLRELGVSIAVDDFGTGYSSLAYLRRFPVDTIKIDQSFVSGVGQDETDTALVQAAIQMAHALKLQAVAEGVETEEQCRCLCELGCDLLQGYFFSHPLTSDQIQLALITQQTNLTRHAA